MARGARRGPDIGTALRRRPGIRVTPGPVIVILYKDIAFASVGEGIGVNLIHGEKYIAGVSVGYDLGRPMSDDWDHLHGLGNIDAAPVVKAFASYVISKSFPLVFRADVRRIVGGSDGLLGDFSAFMPLPGSSQNSSCSPARRLPSPIASTIGRYSVWTRVQAADSLYSIYNAHGGLTAVGIGFSASRFITDHWLLNADLAWNRLEGSASASPIAQSNEQGVIEFSTEYRWYFAGVISFDGCRAGGRGVLRLAIAE